MTNLTNPNLNVAIVGYTFGPRGITVHYAYGITAAPYKLRRRYAI